MSADLHVPYGIDARGRTADSPSYDQHVRDMIEMLLFTSPGERVNRPDFGSGLRQLVFGPNDPELTATVEYTARAALLRWLSDVVQVDELHASAAENVLRVDVAYLVLRTGEHQEGTFVREVPS